MPQNVVYLNHLTFELESVASGGIYHLTVQGEQVRAIRFLHEPTHKVFKADRDGQILAIENTLFRVGAKWRYTISNDDAVRELLARMLEYFPAPPITLH